MLVNYIFLNHKMVQLRMSHIAWTRIIFGVLETREASYY